LAFQDLIQSKYFDSFYISTLTLVPVAEFSPQRAGALSVPAATP